ncbi:MAG: 50S ribosomal protein L24 [Thermoplasmata archaeon]|jgi:large subunit ribosomal protein L24|nr:50S ribosomal protein L24 [Thermoplasmata archaeon]MBO5547334.1 50S ribosomal protein L24 [Candidatus Methanomethylophilaceae archaeon]MBR4686536.1 50S ribosomal protein L24 [Candidatus Methanomethylophilaceae archaeon]WII06851.1 50S ribosomal protein L24 [Methanomassiliicoccales archaeon LGM-RCC1]
MVSSKARVQRKAQANATAHVKRKMLSAHLSDELREKYGKRAARVCKGDTVIVVRGNEDIRNIEGKVINVYTKTGRVAIEGITIKQADGTEAERPIHASNLVITKLNTEDAWRMDSLSKKEAKE